MTIDLDQSWFFRHPGRQAHMRLPNPGEASREFQMLGDHDVTRRRMLIWFVPRNAKMYPGQILRIPFLLKSDETIRDDDETLLPFIHELMMDAAREHGLDART